MRALLALFLLCLSTVVQAHSIGRSSSDWVVGGSLTTGRWVVAAQELETLVYYSSGKDRDFDSALNQFVGRIGVSQAGQPCSVVLDGTPGQTGSDHVLLLRADCAADRLDFRGLFAVSPGHVHLLRYDTGAGRQERLLTRAVQAVDLVADGPVAEQGFGPYLGLGVFHILEGLDHLAFLLALMLAVRSLKALVWCITGFTLGHSLTLALGALGAVVPNPAVVEPLIAFTIAFTVADWAIARDHQPRRLMAACCAVVLALALADRLLAGIVPPMVWAGLMILCLSVWGIGLGGAAKAAKILPVVTVGFGLIHGFGFVGVLSDIGLPVEDRLLALLGFNLGVEAGQLLFLATGLILVYLARRFAARLIPVAEPVLAASILGLGLYWFSERVFLT